MSYQPILRLPQLNSERLRLRTFSPSDGAQVSALAGDRLVAMMTGSLPHPYTPEMAGEWIGRHESFVAGGTQFVFAIENRFENTLIGCVSLLVDLQQAHRAELGYWIGKMFWSKGYATEAASIVVDWGFEELNKEKIFARHFGMNPASGKVLSKIGMKPEGILREHFVRWGVPHDICHYGMLRDEWESRKKS